MNKVILIGNLANDPELRNTQSGISTCSFRLAVQRNFVNQQTGKRDADFINIVTWRQTADVCAKYLRKGSKAAVEGSIQTRSYTAQDGTMRYVTEINADHVEFLNTRGDAQSAAQSAGTGQAANVSSYDDDDDQLPF